jgi:hypothetical protein
MRNFYRFNCPRTCPYFERRDWCRFNPLLCVLTRVDVNSHTARVKTDFTDPGALRRAVESINGQWIGEGTHSLYSTKHTGLAFTLQGWSFPVVLENGELAYDNYNGAWGDTAQLERLKAEYSFSLLEERAQALGWQYERTPEGLTVYHPQGGSLTLDKSAQLEAHGFQGEGCHSAMMELNMPLTDLAAKAEYAQQSARVELPQAE